LDFRFCEKFPSTRAHQWRQTSLRDLLLIPSCKLIMKPRFSSLIARFVGKPHSNTWLRPRPDRTATTRTCRSPRAFSFPTCHRRQVFAHLSSGQHRCSMANIVVSGPSSSWQFHRYYSTVTLCQIPGLVYVAASADGYVVGRQQPRMIPIGQAETSVGICCAANDYSGHLAGTPFEQVRFGAFSGWVNLPQSVLRELVDDLFIWAPSHSRDASCF
jgi:hypothetical protein